jgi:RNA polymerase sigma-70 factor (ECF subfamily)
MDKGALCDPHALIQLMRDGDLEALDRMSRCYGLRLMAVGRRYCGDEDRAKDAVQEALLSAGKHLKDFRGEGSPEGWLVRMVANACHRMRRGRKNDPRLHVSADDVDPVDPFTSPEGEALRGELAEALGKALLDLQPRDRTILLLAEADGWKGPEIATELDMTPEAVRQRLSRLRRRLRVRLQPLWEEMSAT